MKKTKQLFFLIAFLLSAILTKAQAPNTCSAAISKSYPLTTFSVTGYSDSTYWFKMSLNAGNYQLSFLNQSSSGKIYSIGAYLGTCGSQTLITEKKFYKSDSITLDIEFSIPSSQTVYFKFNNTGINSSFIISGSPMCLVSGNIGFCAGETVTLTAQSWNYVGTPSYTWMPGASNATVITITPTTSTTFTLICNSGAGVVNHTVTVFPLPAQFCNSCDYIYNGSFESFGPHPDYGIREAWKWTWPGDSYIPGGGASGSPLYSSSFYTIGPSASVPTNLNHTNLSAKTGHNYTMMWLRGDNWSFLDIDQRTYGSQKLKYPLASGQTYSVGFYLAVSDHCNKDVSAGFGAYLSTSTLVMPSANLGYVFPTTYTPQVVSTTTAIGCYTWTPISGTVTGAGEQYLTLGNFKNDAATPSYSKTCGGSCPPGTANNEIVLMFMDDISITPVPASLSVSNPTITNCSQTTMTLSATGAAPAYTSWTDGINTYTGSVVVVPVPVFATTYTCSVNLPGVGSCGLGGTVTVYNGCTTCSTPTNVLASSLTSTTLSNTFYAMNNNLVINGNVTFDKCEIQIIKSASITVTPGSTLNILGSHLYACGDMWQGIVVQSGGVINFNTSGPKSSFIEDAIEAVYIAGSTLTTNILTSINTTFNKNKTSIKISGYSQTVAPYPFTIHGNVITCRTISFTPGSITWPHCNTVKAATNPTTSPLQTPYINDVTYPPTVMKIPYSTSKPDYGIFLDGVGSTINPSTTPTYYEIQIGTNSGSNTYNTFDNLYFGIYSLDANIYSINNIFQKAQTFGKGGNAGGMGIYSITNGAITNRRLKVTGASSTTFINKFFDCCRAINTSNIFEHIITDCDLRSTAAYYLLPTIPINPIGNMGVNIVTPQYRNVNVSGNHLYNISNGIIFTADVGYYAVGGPLSLGRYGGQIDFNNNEIRAALPSQTISTQFVNVAISINDIMTSTSGYSVYTIPSTSICANTNTISDVWNGITQSNFGQQPATVWNNTITLVNQPNSLATPPVQSGVCNNQLVNGFIYRNTISGPSTYTTQMKAITTSMNSTLTVKCNTTSQTTRGIEFNSSQANTVFWDNAMSSHTNGLTLDNSGIIGTQGSSTIPTDNQWTGTWTVPNYKTVTYLSASSATNSRLYIRFATGSYDPNGSGNTTGVLGTDNYCYSCTGNALVNITGSPSARTCPSTPLCPTCRGSQQVELIASNELLLEQLVNNKILYRKSTPELEYMNQLYVYRQLKSKPKTKNQSLGNSALNLFYNNVARTNIGVLDDIEFDLLNADYSSAKTKIAALTPTNAIETNYKNYYAAYINSKEGNFSSIDSINLTSLANGCPFTDGGVVYQARALYNVAFDTYRLFYDICVTGGEAQRLLNDSEQKNISTINFSRIFPNPTNGLLNVEVSNAKDKEEISIDVFDITGKSVYSSKQVLNNKTVVLDPDLSSGTYLIKVKLNDGTTDVHRLIINK